MIEKPENKNMEQEISIKVSPETSVRSKLIWSLCYKWALWSSGAAQQTDEIAEPDYNQCNWVQGGAFEKQTTWCENAEKLPAVCASLISLPSTSFLPFNMRGISIQSRTEMFSKWFLFCRLPLYLKEPPPHREMNHVPKAAQLIRKATNFTINISVTHSRS